MPHRSPSLHYRWLFLSLCVLSLAGCRRDTAELPGAATEPAAAVRQLAGYLKDDDLAGYARAAVLPAQYAQLEAAWSRGDSRWPISELPLGSKLPDFLAALSAEDAGQQLHKVFDVQIAGQAAGIRQASHSLGLFGVQYLGRQGDYSDEQRDHYVQLVTALSDWAMAAPLTDPELAKGAISTLTTAARTAALNSDADFQEAGMSGSLQRLGPVLRGFKQVLDSYGLSLDDSLSQLRTGLATEHGDSAMVRVQYPVAGKNVDIKVALVRHAGRWYLEQTLSEVEVVLAAAVKLEQARIEAEAEVMAEAAAKALESAGEAGEPSIPSAKP